MRVIVVVAAAFIACKASHSDANDGGVATPSPLAASSVFEVQPSSEAPPEPKGLRLEKPMASSSDQTPPARPLSSSLSELGRATDFPEIEGEPAIAVFVERVSGGLMPNIEHATSRLRAGMRACYLRSMEDDLPDASRLALRIVVSTNGSVKSARPEDVSNIGESALDCMVRRAQTATFPPAVGEPAEIVLSIAFLPPGLHER